MNKKIDTRMVLGFIAMGAAVTLAGCGTVSGNSAGSLITVALGTAIQGRVHGGQQPVSGATIQLYAVGINGTGSASTALLTQAVTSLADGSFSITGDYSCTNNTATYGTNPLLYITATGGNPGLPGNVNNTALAMMVALGPCSNLTPSTFTSINELTTVASVYALAPFMTDIAHIAAPAGANSYGLANAFTTTNVLANTTTGTSPGPMKSANSTVPTTLINTIADLIALCVNSQGASDPGGSCTNLFNDTTVNGSVPSNTIGALQALAQNPSLSLTDVFQRLTPTEPFLPALSSAPADYTIAINTTGGGLNSPSGLAVDSAGNVWVANAAGNSVSEFNAQGASQQGTTGYTAGGLLLGPQGLALSRNGDLWIANTLVSNLVKIPGANTSATPSVFSSGINGPTSIAFDSGNNVWVTNYGSGTLVELTSTGAPVNSPLTANSVFVSPSSVSLDTQGNVVVADPSAYLVDAYSDAQALESGAGYNGSGTTIAPSAVATDSSNRVWIANLGGASVSLISQTGGSLLSAPITGGGVSMPSAIAIDGGGSAWVTSESASRGIAKLMYVSSSSTGTAVSPPIGYGVLASASGIAIDASGNVWTANSGDNSISQFVGLALPVNTPLATRVGP